MNGLPENVAAPAASPPRSPVRMPPARRPSRPGVLCVLLPLLVGLLFAAAPVRAQESALAQIEARFAAGDYGGAREMLRRWWDTVPDADGRLRARALLLRAKLATEPRAAERDYLAVALGHPTAPEAAEALLRLAQALAATGDLDRSAAYLERLLADYPGAEQRGTALLWLARVRREAGRTGPACDALDRVLAAHAQDRELHALATAEHTGLCPAEVPRPAAEAAARAAGPDAPARPPPADRPAAREPAATPAEDAAREPAAAPMDPAARDPAAAEPPVPTTPFAVQAGAFRQPDGARQTAERLRAAGFEARIVRVPGSELLRVRVGAFRDLADAQRLLASISAAGFDAAVVRDAHRERTI